jgi:hypothetical protein
MVKSKLRVETQQYRDAVIAVLDDLRDYWPLTLRQVYYQLVASGTIENNRNEYQKLSRNLSAARLEGAVPWAALEDRARSMHEVHAWEDRDEFVESTLAHFLRHYRRDLLQEQDEALEVWIEKDALSSVCYRAAEPYCVPVVVARGFASTSYKHECRLRVVRNAKRGQKTHILYFGDLDPSGWEMLPAMMNTLQLDMELGELVQATRCALTQEQVSQYNLPRNPDALKASDPRAKKYMKQFGNLAVELDALPPATLQSIVRCAIERRLDMELFAKAVAKQEEDVRQLGEYREQVLDLLDQQ